MIGQLLNRSVVVSQLPRLAADLERVAAGEVERPPQGADVTEDELLDAAKLLAEAAARPPQDEDDGDQGGTRRAETAPIEDYAYIPRDAVTCIVQSSLDEYLHERHGDRVQRVAVEQDRRRADGLPPVTDEYLDGETLVDSTAGGQTRRLFGRFEIPSNPGWVSCLIAQGIRHWKGKRTFVDKPARFESDASLRLVLVGDWATGVPRARRVADEMHKVLEQGFDDDVEQHVVHLGDVYYSGFDYEYERRFLPYWPVQPEEAGVVTSWNLMGNHDMYSGGHGFFDVLDKDDRFAAQKPCSYFELRNEHWTVLGLDTGWEEGGLAGRQVEWLEERLAAAEGRRTLLLSHHQLFSVFGKGAEGLRTKVLPLLGRRPVDAWFWGHEHRCMTFAEHEGVGYGVCLGHGGVPVYQWHKPETPVDAPGIYEYRDVIRKSLGLEPWGVLGFAVVDLVGAKATVRYVNEFGSEHRRDTI